MPKTSKTQPRSIYLLSCLVLLSLWAVFSLAQAQTSDQLLNAQITASAEIGANDLQASVIIVAGDSIFIDAGKVAGVEKSSYRGGKLMRRTASGEELIGNFDVIEVGGEVSQIAVTTVFGKEVQMSDRAVFGAYSAEVGRPGINNMQAGQSNEQNVFANTFGDNPAGRAIGIATNPAATNLQTSVTNVEVTKSSVIPVGTAASLMAGFVANAAAKSTAMGAPLYCSDARFADREACQAPVPLMAESSVAPVTRTATATTTATVTTTVTAVSTPEYCSSSAYQSRPECSSVANAPTNQAVIGQRGYQPSYQPNYQPTNQVTAQQQGYQHVSQTAPSVAALPGYCIDARFSSRPECVATTASAPVASQTTTASTISSASSVPAYCSTPANQSRPECSGASTSVAHTTQVNQRGYQTQAPSHISTASAANPNAAVGTALAIDPYTGKPYTTSYQGYNEHAATPLVHTAAHSQAAQTITVAAATPTHNAVSTNTGSSTIGLATSSATANTTIDVPAHVGPATIANQTLTTSANSSYATAQTYYDSDWGDNWDPTFVNTTPTASGIIPDGAPAPYFLRIARVKNNLGFPNEAIQILQMGLAQYPNDVSLQSEVTMIYRMLADGGSVDDWCAPEEIGIAPEPIATVDDCPDMESEVEPHTHDNDPNHHDADHGHSHDNDDHHSDYSSDYSYEEEHDDEHSHSSSYDTDDHHTNYDDHNTDHYANDHQENIQVSTRYNAPVNNAPVTNRNNAAPEVNQSYAAQNKPTLTSPVGMANGYYSDEKGGIVRPLWNTEK